MVMIFNVVNGVIVYNWDWLGKELWMLGEEGELILVYVGFNEVDEVCFIVECI